MAGHSKWSNIKHRKAGQDAKRAKVFTKIIRELTIAARDGGGSVDDNPGLRNIVDKAKAVQMPRDTMERAIARGAGGQEGADLVALTYEGYGPGGVAILVETMTDNRNRTVAEIRHAFSKGGGNLGTDGSVAYLFSKKGQLLLESSGAEDSIMDIAIEAGAEDVDSAEDGSVEVITSPEDFQEIKELFLQAGYKTIMAEIAMLPYTYTDLSEENSNKLLILLELLEDIDDVTNIYTNGNFMAETP
jgi:YebC/PmpR family DNA-binding regulatory protein